MNKRYILALDQGTTGSRAFLFDSQGRVVASAYKEFPQYFPKPGWVEHDAGEIWRSCVDVIKGVLRKSRVSSRQIVAIGITNQRETTVLWDRATGRPVHRAIVWQCRRTSEACRELRAKGLEELFRKKTGLVLDPYFSGTKIRWLLDNVPGLRRRATEGGICFGTIDSWLIWNLTGGESHATDATNASRTLIFNIRTKQWDNDLLKILNIPAAILPRVQNSGSVFGHTTKNAGAQNFVPLPSGIPITAVLGDQQAALYGQGCYEAGTVKNTYGTGCFIVLNTGKKLIFSKEGLLSTLASDEKGRPVYALEGSVFIAGAVVQWLRDQVGVIKTSAQTEQMARGIKDTNGVYFVPAFVGLGAPYWDSGARGVICGLTRGASVKHIVRAALESMAYQTKDVFDIMRREFNTGPAARDRHARLGRSLRRGRVCSLRVDGGACKNDFLMQFQADILGCRIARPRMTESTAQGAAHLAGVTIGLWQGKKDLVKLRRTGKIFSPKMSAGQRARLYAGWQEAVKRARGKQSQSHHVTRSPVNR